MSSQSQFTRTLVAMAAALVMSTVAVGAAAARSIADIKEMRRAVVRLDELSADWTGKAELALSKDREDLAKAALVERQKAAEMPDGLRDELSQMEQVLKGYETDIAKLQ